MHSYPSGWKWCSAIQKRVEPQPVQCLRYRLSLVVRGDQVVVTKQPVIDRYSAVADVFHVHVTGVQAIKFGNHGFPHSSRAGCCIFVYSLPCFAFKVWRAWDATIGTSTSHTHFLERCPC